MIQNKWRTLFVSLLVINLVILLAVFILLKIPSKETVVVPQETINNEPTSVLSVESNKENINQLINAYLKESLEDTKYKYNVHLDDVVHLSGELPVFSAAIPLYIQLEPIVQSNGDIILKQKSIRLGLLELPNEKILQYMGKYLPLPEWVVIDAKNEEIYVKITEMELDSGFVVKIRDFDLVDDKIKLDFIVPHNIFKKAEEKD